MCKPVDFQHPDYLCFHINIMLTLDWSGCDVCKKCNLPGAAYYFLFLADSDALCAFTSLHSAAAVRTARYHITYSDSEWAY